MSFIDRLHNEKSELHHKLTSLNKFIGSDDYLKLDLRHQILLSQQSAHMAFYHYVLELRISLLETPKTYLDEMSKKVITIYKDGQPVSATTDEPAITGPYIDEPPAFSD